MKQLQLNGIPFTVWGDAPYAAQPFESPENFYFIVDKDGVNTVSMAMDNVRSIFDQYTAVQIVTFLNQSEQKEMTDDQPETLEDSTAEKIAPSDT